MSSTDQIVTLFESLSFAEKLSLNERLATVMRKEGGGAAGKKRGPKAKDADKPKRKAALGTLAWMAYVKHIKETQPEMLEGHTKESEKLAIIKGIRAEDAAGYNAFVASWKEEHKDDASELASEVEAEDDASVASEAPAPKVQTAAEKIAAMRAAKAASAAAAPAPAPKKEQAKATPAPAPKKATPAAPKKAVKAAAAAPKKEEPKMPVITIEDTEYWHDPETNGLWEKTGDVENGSGPWIGYWQPEDTENPIRFTEAYGSD